VATGSSSSGMTCRYHRVEAVMSVNNEAMRGVRADPCLNPVNGILSSFKAIRQSEWDGTFDRDTEAKA
jgi:hypothetical protein